MPLNARGELSLPAYTADFVLLGFFFFEAVVKIRIVSVFS